MPRDGEQATQHPSGKEGLYSSSWKGLRRPVVLRDVTESPEHGTTSTSWAPAPGALPALPASITEHSHEIKIFFMWYWRVASFLPATVLLLVGHGMELAKRLGWHGGSSHYLPKPHGSHWGRWGVGQDSPMRTAWMLWAFGYLLQEDPKGPEGSSQGF